MFSESEEIEKKPIGPRSRGAELFKTCKKFEMTQQMRAAEDSCHSQMLDKMRNPIQGKSYIDSECIKRIKTLDRTDIISDPLWSWAPIVVTSNKERTVINDFQSKRWSLHFTTPRFVWKIPLTGNLATSIPPDLQSIFYENCKALFGCFVCGAPGNIESKMCFIGNNQTLFEIAGHLTKNINPSRGLSNGTRIIYNSITLDERENLHGVMELISLRTGRDIELEFPPKYIHVEVPDANPEYFVGITMIPGKVVIPIAMTNPEYYQVQVPFRNEKVRVIVKSHGVELGFSCIVHKMQGLTCGRVIIDVNKRPFQPQICYHGPYVAFSRVKRGEHIRLLPLQPTACNMNHLEQLKPTPALMTWAQGYDSEGVWSSSNVPPQNRISGANKRKRRDGNK